MASRSLRNKSSSPSWDPNISKVSSAIAAKFNSYFQENFSSTTAIKKSYADIINKPKGLKEAAQYIYRSLLDDAILGISIEIHHLCKIGKQISLHGALKGDAKKSNLGNANDSELLLKTIACPQCGANVCCSRFAPHLDKCMGLGRASFNLAKQRLATPRAASKFDCQSYNIVSDIGEDADDDDWSPRKRRKSVSQKRCKTPRKPKKNW